MPRPIKLAVIGAGIMGRRHLATAKANASVELVAVVDSDGAAARAAAQEFGCTALSLDALAGKIDAAIVAVPTAAHAPIAVPLLREGIACLVEKPLAGTEADGRALIAAAAEGRAVLQVGHIERFNPAIQALARINTGVIQAMAARRISAASARVTDIDVVTDLMIHDLDVVLSLKKAAVANVSAAGSDDHAVALVTFDDGSTATLTASRITPTRIRDLDVTAEKGFFHLDYIGRTLAENTTSLPVTPGDALAAQLDDFLSSIRDKRSPRVGGADALAAMQLVTRIRAAIKGSLPA